jgi:CheY-like chemotaxis protein
MPNILIIDDMPEVRAAIRNTLNPPLTQQQRMQALISGKSLTGLDAYTIGEAGQGEDGVALITRDIGYYHLAIIDMRMPPGIDGAETIRRIRAVGFVAPIIVCTAFSDYTDADLTQANRQPIRVLQKPYKSADLLDAVTQALAGAGGG